MTDLVSAPGDTRLSGRTWARPQWTVAEVQALLPPLVAGNGPPPGGEPL